MNCLFKKAWVGQCKNEAVENGYCEKHKNLKCESCGEKATHECHETIVGFICGASLCDNCVHTLHDNGCNSNGKLPEGFGPHCKKSEQVYKSWVEQDFIKRHGEKAYLKLKEELKNRNKENKMEWRIDFENIPKGDFIACYERKSCFAHRDTKKVKEVNILPQNAEDWIYGLKIKYLDGWMPMPEGVK